MSNQMPSDLPTPSKNELSAVEDSRPSNGRPIFVGFAVVATFVAVFGAWSTMVSITSAVVAPGLIKVEGQRKTVQHLEGGIVGKIQVREGDRVTMGQVLIHLDDTQPRATLELIHGRYLAARTLEARLIARRDNLTEISFPEDVRNADPEIVQPMMAGQVGIFRARNKSLKTEKGILNQRIAQLGDEITGLEGQISAEDRQLELVSEELAGLRELYEKGLTKRDRILMLERGGAAIEGNRSMHVADVARARQGITEAQLQIDRLGTDLLRDAVQELRDTQKEVYELAQRIVALRDVLARTDIEAPISGTVVGLQVHSARGVIAPGAALLDIVPDGGRLIVEVQVQPADIDIVHADSPAEIRFTAFDAADFTPVDGVVRSVSADRLTDERNGTDYFLAHVEITSAIEDAMAGAVLSPGMQAEVMIHSGVRTPLEYLIAPLTKSFRRALREE